jgi:RNA polymerase sigma-70 factor (ECF subfamily)
VLPVSSKPAKQDERFVELLSRNQHRIYGFIYSLLPNYTDAEEILHQTTVVLWRKWDQLAADDDFVRWACGIARNEIRNYLRLHERRNEYLSDELLESLATNAERMQPLLAERKEALSHCVGDLDPADRELLSDCYSGETPIRSVADRLEIAPNALYKKLARLRRVLFLCIERRLAAEANS